MNLIKSWKLKCNFKKTFSPLCYILTWKANILVCVLICCNVFTPLCKVSKRQNHYFNDFFLPFLKTFLFLFFFLKLLLNWWKETNKLQHNSDLFSHFFSGLFFSSNCFVIMINLKIVKLVSCFLICSGYKTDLHQNPQLSRWKVQINLFLLAQAKRNLEGYKQR